MEYSYPALALRELESFSVKEFEKNWLAPDTFFTIAKIPKYSVVKKEEGKTVDFTKEGMFWLEESNLRMDEGGWVIENKPSILLELLLCQTDV